MGRRLEYLDRVSIDSHPFFLFPRIRMKISSPMPVSRCHTLGKFISSCDWKKQQHAALRTHEIVTSSLAESFLPDRSWSTASPSASFSYNALTLSSEAWLAMSMHGTIEYPCPGKSSIRDRYTASTYFQSSRVNRPVSSSHQYFWHQDIWLVDCWMWDNSCSRAAILASTADWRDVPRSNSNSSSV